MPDRIVRSLSLSRRLPEKRQMTMNPDLVKADIKIDTKTTAQGIKTLSNKGKKRTVFSNTKQGSKH